MKTTVTTFLFLLFLLKSFLSYSQTQITNKDFEVSDDVVKVEEVRFKETNDFTEDEDYTDLYEFSKGRITGKIRIIENKLVDEVYYNNYNSTEFSYENYNKTFGDYKAQYQVITFNQLKFYYPKTDFVVIQDKPNILFEFSYSIQGRKITRKFEKIDNNYITDTYDDYGYHVDTYNTNGQKVKTETKSLTKSDLFYSSDGLLEHSETIYGKYIDKPYKTYYSYQKDKKGNWVKRVQISLDSDNKIKTAFTSRQITYANGEVSGSIYYDPAFVKWEIVVYSPDLKDDVSQKTKGCISGDCQNGFGKRTYGEKDVYEGGFKEGLKYGKGTYIFANEDKYIGDFKEGQMSGFGTYTSKNGNKYEGNFKRNQFSGFGAFTTNEGNKVEVNWENGKQNGKGIIYDYKNNIKKEVIIKDDKIVEVLSETAISENKKENTITTLKTGCIKGDCQNGVGTFVGIEGKDTIKIVGNFKNAVFSGYGKSYLNGQLTYDGQWDNFKYNGKGKLYTGYNNESRFVGEFKNGIKEGPCKMYTNEKLVFEGTYVNNSIEGKGTYYDYKTEKKIVSIYKNGSPTQVISSESIKNENNSLTSNKIPNGIVWKKNEENTEFWLYNNKIEITGNVFFLDNDLYVFLPNTKQIYVLGNFNQQKANTYYFANLLPEKFPHGAYIKRNATGLIAVNAKGEIIKSNSIFKFAPGGGDIIYKGTNETETLLFKNFTNAKINKVYPAEIYNTATATTNKTFVNNSSDNLSFQTEIQECKNSGKEVNCLIDKITNKYTSLKNSGVADDIIYTKLGADFNAIGAYKVDALFDIIFNLNPKVLPKEKYSKILAKMSKEQRANLRAHASKITEEYARTHKMN